MSSIKLTDLKPEELQALRQQVLADEENKKEKIKDERKTYKKLVNETVPVLFGHLEKISLEMSRVKKTIYSELEALVKIKAEVFQREDGQYSHSFTTETGLTIIIGHRINDGWDDTVTAGLDKVNKYLESLGKDKDSKTLVKAILKLLSKDSKGNLKSGRVLQLRKIAEETGNADFIDALKIILDAHRPVPSKEFVTARYRDNNGETVDLPLDISAVDFDLIIKRAE